jgi:hypothetical protein
VDTNNDIIVTGRSRNNLTPHYSYYVTVKYSSAGVAVWTNRYNGSAGMNIMDGATAVAVDGNNDVIVTGHSDNPTYATYDYATIKYSSTGVPLWTNRYNQGSTFGATAYGVVVDRSNNVIVTGVVLGTSSSSYSTIKYSSAGVPLWTNACAGPADGAIGSTAAAVDGNGDAIVTGYITRSTGSTEFATIKYATDGQPLWTNRYSGTVVFYPTEDKSCSLAVDPRNSVIVSGYAAGNTGDANYAAIKYSSSGAAIWTNRYNGPGNGDDFAQQVVLDHGGNVILTGTSIGSLTNYEFATIKYAFPLIFNNCELTNGMFQGEVDNLQAGALVIEASTDLTNWLPIYTNPVPTNVLFYADPDTGKYPGRFYRAYQSP